jgi:hypothetical protein
MKLWLLWLGGWLEPLPPVQERETPSVGRENQKASCMVSAPTTEHEAPEGLAKESSLSRILVA